VAAADRPSIAVAVSAAPAPRVSRR
jgi:hypothetical protein